MKESKIEIELSDIEVGKPVTINDALGQMGSTGNSTGPHLHISVIDCGLYVPGDYNCYDLNSFFNYNKRRFNEECQQLSYTSSFSPC